MNCRRFYAAVGLLTTIMITNTQLPEHQPIRPAGDEEGELLNPPPPVTASDCAADAASGRCYLRKMPGETCQWSEECADVRGLLYYCIQHRCSLPPNCSPGHVHVGPTCVSFAVTGGECAHPIQCLSGSLCMRGRCRGPCDDNQLFVGDECVDYEGAGCIARSCVDGECPRAFPSCNWVPQKRNYLCCERAIRMSEHCPHANSIPQVDPKTGEIAHCFDNNCAAGYACQFSKYRHSYICCSELPANFSTPATPTSLSGEWPRAISPFQSLRRGGGGKSSGKRPVVPPSISSSSEILRRCCADAECLRRHPRIGVICGRFFFVASAYESN